MQATDAVTSATEAVNPLTRLHLTAAGFLPSAKRRDRGTDMRPFGAFCRRGWMELPNKIVDRCSVSYSLAG